jgi:small basic protein
MRQEARDEEEELERKRSFLLVLATLAATVTYDAGLSPPGGFWSHDKGPDYLAGDPVLRNHYPRRFKAFLVCNATAFAGSLVIIIMLLSDTAVDHVVKSNALQLCVLASLFGLMGAYAAGSCRDVRTTIFVFSLVGTVLLYLVIQWIEPIVTKPLCVENAIGWIRTKKGSSETGFFHYER